MSYMPRTLVLIGLISALLAPATADARSRHTSRQSARPRGSAAQTPAPANPQALAASLAARYWHAVPCGGQITVLARQPLAVGLAPSTDAWATFASSLGRNDLSAPAQTYKDCVITLARWQWPTQAAMRSDWGMFCLTVIHEWGHLLGHPHSSAVGSVMAPLFSDESSVPAICRAARSSPDHRS